MSAQSGIYVIRNTVTGDFYIGSSVNLHRRKAGHLHRLRRGVGVNPRLQAAWDAYGPSAFVFEVICLMNGGELLAVEGRLLARLVGHPACYNFAVVAKASMLGRKHTPETRAKMSASWTPCPLRGAALRETLAAMRAAGSPRFPPCCPNGHAFTRENTRWELRGGGRKRRCRICLREKARRCRAKKKVDCPDFKPRGPYNITRAG